MAFKGDVSLIVTVTSTNIMFTENTLGQAPFYKSCRAEVVGGGVKRLIQNLDENPKQAKISRSVRVFPIRSGTYYHDPRKQWLLRHQGELAYTKVQSRPTEVVSRVPLYPPNTGPDFGNGGHIYPPAPQVPFFPCPTPTPVHTSARPKGGRPTNPIPRHKRSSHINAEHRRRSKIQKGFDAIKELIPALTEEVSSKDSKSEMLHKTAAHIGEMASDLKKQQDEISRLKQEINDLNSDIELFQQTLPSSGIAAVDKPSCHIESMYKNYLKSRTQQNWKFWLFSFILRPLFESYTKMVTTSSYSIFLQNVREWAHEHLSLVNLRPCILSALRQISLKSSILTSPRQLPEEVHGKVADFCENK